MTSFLNRVVDMWALVGALCLAIIVLVTAVNVGALGLDFVTRNFGHRVAGVYGYEDIARLLASVAALSFFPICQMRGGHVAVGLLVDQAPRLVQRVISSLSALLTCGLAVFLTLRIFEGALEVWRDGLTTGVLEWPQWPFYWPGVVSMALWALVAGWQALELLRGKDVPHGSA